MAGVAVGMREAPVRPRLDRIALITRNELPAASAFVARVVSARRLAQQALCETLGNATLAQARGPVDQLCMAQPTGVECGGQPVIRAALPRREIHASEAR
jgi:hypothetical protein